MTPLRICAVAALLALIFTTLHANSHRDPWYFTAEEIETAYRFQLTFGERINAPIDARGCLVGHQKVRVTYRGREFWLSCRFVKETTRHLGEMLDAGAAKFLFPLDADHAHLAVPKSSWEEKFRKLPVEEILPAILAASSTIALYHTAEHLTVADPATGAVDPKVKVWKDKRNVIGYYNGQPIKILAPHPLGVGAGTPPEYLSFGSFRFLASPHGQLYLFRRKEAITFDISLEYGKSSDEPFPFEFVANR